MLSLTTRKRSVIDFVGKWKITFAIAVVCILSGPVAMAINSGAGNGALNLERGFPVGGTSTSVTFNEDLSISDIDSKVKPLFQDVTGDAEIQSQKVAGSNDVYIKTPCAVSG